jgi:DNA (cytosine-5)-methyltransferase 1
MNYISLFSGLEGAALAWPSWHCAAVAEVDPAACAVLQHHYPNVPNLGDVTKVTEKRIKSLGHVDLVVFGSPCQDLSIAGKRKGLKGERSGLFFCAIRIVRWSRARFALWENVPGAFSSNDGRDFALVVGEMAGVSIDVPDSGWANSGFLAGLEGLVEWAVLDAQFFRVPQRRRRVFALRDIGDWQSRPPILLERESLQGHPVPRRDAGEVSPTIPARCLGGGGLGTDFDCDGGGQLLSARASSLTASTGGGMGRQDYESETLIAHALRADGFDASEDGIGRGTPLIAIAIQGASTRENPDSGPDGIGVRTDDLAYTLEAREEVQAVAFSCKDHGADAGELAPTLRSMGHNESHANAGGQIAVAIGIDEEQNATIDGMGCLKARKEGGGFEDSVMTPQMAVRRLTPKECCRLQGVPDDYLSRVHRNGKPLADGPMYKMLGNGFAVPVVAWIGKRLEAVTSEASE